MVYFSNKWSCFETPDGQKEDILLFILHMQEQLLNYDALLQIKPLNSTKLVFKLHSLPVDRALKSSLHSNASVLIIKNYTIRLQSDRSH